MSSSQKLPTGAEEGKESSMLRRFTCSLCSAASELVRRRFVAGCWDSVLFRSGLTSTRPGRVVLFAARVDIRPGGFSTPGASWKDVIEVIGKIKKIFKLFLPEDLPSDQVQHCWIGFALFVW